MSDAVPPPGQEGLQPTPAPTVPDRYVQQKKRIEDLLMGFTEHTQKRLEKLEGDVQRLNEIVRLRDHSGATAAVAAVAAASQVGGSEALPLPVSLCPPSAFDLPAPAPPLLMNETAPSIRFGAIQTKWFTKRPYPVFHVWLVNPDGTGFTDTQNWQVAVSLVTAHGLLVEHFMNAPSLVFPVTDGKATITGIKFTAVSSRNGGYFQFQVSVVNPVGAGVTPARSPEFRVLSERLKNENKADSISDLSAGSALSRAPGIGKKYSRRFAQAGLTTVRDLASLDTPEKRNAMLSALCTDRGALTEARLLEMVTEAQEVARRADAEIESARKRDLAESDNESPLPKRTRPTRGTYGAAARSRR